MTVRADPRYVHPGEKTLEEKLREIDSAADNATLRRVSPNPKRSLSTDDEKLIREALDARDQADENLRNAIVEVSARSSVRVLAEFTGMSTNTISRWKAGARSES